MLGNKFRKSVLLRIVETVLAAIYYGSVKNGFDSAILTKIPRMKKEGLGRRQTAKCDAKRQARACPVTTPQHDQSKELRWFGSSRLLAAIRVKGCVGPRLSQPLQTLARSVLLLLRGYPFSEGPQQSHTHNLAQMDAPALILFSPFSNKSRKIPSAISHLQWEASSVARLLVPSNVSGWSLPSTFVCLSIFRRAISSAASSLP